MTDNYQFDKNSKLFQKFLAMKANRVNEPTVQYQSDRVSQVQNQHQNKSFFESSKQHLSKKNQSAIKQSLSNHQKGLLHVTIDDIEEAASVGLNQSTINYNDIPQKQENKEEFCHKKEKYEEAYMKTNVQNQIEDICEQKNVRVMPKQQRIRDRRTRQYHEKPRKDKEQKMKNKIQQVNDDMEVQIKPAGFEISFKPGNNQFCTHSQNIEPNITEDHVKKIGEGDTMIKSKQNQYRKKYQKIVIKYEQLKEILQEQRRKLQSQAIERQSQNEILKEKYYQLRSAQDTLMTDVKRFKDRLQSENITRTKLEEQVKELNFRIVELEEILQGKEASLKKKSEEVTHWKQQNEQMRTQLKQYTAQIQRLEERSNFIESQYKIMHRDISNKENLIDELRRNTGTLIEQNNIAKDEIYKLTIKLYQLQQENMSLKADVIRKDREMPHNFSMIQQNYTRNIEKMSPKRSLQRVDKKIILERQQAPNRQGNHGRKRQFARERITTKINQTQKIYDREERKEKKIQCDRIPTNNQAREIAGRIQYIQNELQERSKMKTMNGRLRKEKIQLERQLESLLQKID